MSCLHCGARVVSLSPIGLIHATDAGYKTRCETGATRAELPD